MRKRVVIWQVIVLAAVFSLGAKKEKAQQPQQPAKPFSSAAGSETSIEEMKKLQKESAPILENILIAMNEKNYLNYSRDFNDSMKSAYTEDVFKKNTKMLQESIGNYISKTPFKMEKMQQHFVVYYNAKFTKARGPVIVRLVLQKAEQPENKLQVAFLSFDAPELKDLKVKQRKWWRLWLF